ncbi:hypothetical protein [Halostella litorea]|uniref:hypothetical protein n=1 Tax=Halostella litorea TaxID=2528831 RepID=UPI001092C0D9|nr:hypothetical protein [Halostella litorea]
MPSESDGRTPERGVVATVRGTLGKLPVGMLLLGVLAGASAGTLGDGPVAVPFVGPVSGTLLGGAGLAVAAAAYYRTDACGCGDADCGCAGDCGDCCSYDPE